MKLAQIEVGAKVLAGMLLGSNRKTTSSLPKDLEVRFVNYEPYRHTYVVTVWSDSFLDIPEAMIIPRISPLYITEQSELDWLRDELEKA